MSENEAERETLKSVAAAITNASRCEAAVSLGISSSQNGAYMNKLSKAVEEVKALKRIMSILLCIEMNAKLANVRKVSL